MNFKKYRIADLIDDISMGPFGSNIKVDCFVDSGVPVLNGSNLDGFTLKEESFRYVTEQKADSLKRANAKKGDIVITHRGTLGQIVYIPQNAKYERYVISQSQFRIRCNEHVLPEYLVFYFHTRVGQHKILSNASQVGVPALARPSTTFQQIEVELPDIEVQKKIVSILQSFNDKIELNNKINANLQQQAQAIFKSWFVDFEPFQDGEFVESELGTIPVEFTITRTGGLPLIVTDYVANGSFASLKANVHLYQERNYAYFIRNTDLKSGEFKVFVDEHSYNFLSKSRLQGGEIIISNVGDVGSVFLCPVLDAPMTLGNNMIMLKPECQELQYYLYIWFKYSLGQNLIQGIKSGSAQPKFNKTDFKSLPIVLPPDKILQEFHEVVSPIFKLVEKNQLENRKIAMLRDVLLPKLMNGEIDIIKD